MYRMAFDMHPMFPSSPILEVLLIDRGMTQIWRNCKKGNTVLGIYHFRTIAECYYDNDASRKRKRLAGTMT